MRARHNRYRDLIYNGDWQTSLVAALQLAKEGNCSKDIVATIKVLERQLDQRDECVHTITAVKTVPPDINPQFLLRHFGRCIDVKPATINLSSKGEIELTITARGSYEYVLATAEEILSNILNSARAEIWVEQLRLPILILRRS